MIATAGVNVDYSGLSLVDDVGRVFLMNGKVLRGINPDSIEHVRKLLDSGLIAELVEKNLFPKTWISETVIQGFPMVLEHEHIPAITYPGEWSFEMLKDAALLILKICIIAKNYGYHLKDCHGYNVGFKGSHPLFIDFGSFSETTHEPGGWVGYEEFLQFYLYPLRLWRDGNEYIARRILADHRHRIPHDEYFRYAYSLAKMIDANQLARIAKIFVQYRNLKTISRDQFERKLPWFISKPILWARDRNLLPFQAIDFQSLINSIQAIRNSTKSSTWGDYHQFYYGTTDKYPKRFERILELVIESKAESVLELAGNQGFFSRIMEKSGKFRQIICSDYDANAVDVLYDSSKKFNSSVVPALFDFMFPSIVNNGDRPQDRFKSDAVLALAVVHHLILGQKLNLNHVFETIAGYSNRYVFIEFMPLGLWRHGEEPNVPDWYTVEWFRSHFSRYFNIISEETLEENRILFYGELI